MNTSKLYTTYKNVIRQGNTVTIYANNDACHVIARATLPGDVLTDLECGLDAVMIDGNCYFILRYTNGRLWAMRT